MNEKERHKRALEDVSHFFLSGNKRTTSSEKTPYEEEKKDPPDKKQAPLDGSRGPSLSSQEEKGGELDIARPLNLPYDNDTDIVKTATEYLKNQHTGRFVVGKNIDSPRFGSSDFTLFNKKSFFLICAKIQRGESFSDFLVSSVCYGAWLKESLETSRFFFNKSPRHALYLFCDRSPDMATYFIKQLHGTMPIGLVRYHLFEIPDRPAPVIHFQTLFTVGNDEPNQEIEQKDALNSSPDISEDEWHTFNRLKKRSAFEE